MKNTNTLSEELLLAVKMESDTAGLVKHLALYVYKDLEKELHDDDKKKAFWINIYNSFFF